MSGVTDVTGGMKYLLENDDMVMLKVDNSNGVVTTSLITFDTANSTLSGTPQTTIISTSPSNGGFDSGVMASQATGRMYNTKSDIIAALSAVDNGAFPDWSFTLLDPLTGFHYATQLNSKFIPYHTVLTHVVMGDFNGDELADPLVFYFSVRANGNDARWGMKVLTAANPKTEGPPTEGPELYGDGGTGLAPVAGSIVVGDFNGDSRDEIAALLNDYQTIAFYSVDPKTLVITQTHTVKMGVKMLAGQVALAAGRIRNQSPSITNADLVVFGQIDGGKNGYSVIPLRITPTYKSDGTPAGTFTVNEVQKANATADERFYRFPVYGASSGALAQAAPLAYYPQQINEQLVLGIRTDDGASYIEIGSFVQNNKLDEFDWESETERKYAAGADYLQNMWVGNFDNQNSDGKYNPALQIETYELIGSKDINFYAPHINIFDVNVPSPFSVPLDKKTNWLQQKSDNTSGVPLVGDANHPPRQDILVPGDFQGRSLRLGAPTIVKVTGQIQPDLVLAMPPMHVDYIPPLDTNLAQEQPASAQCDVTNTSKPCVVNVSVLPDFASKTVDAFATQFKFDTSSTSAAKQSSTTSWGISVQESVGASFSFADGEENASGSIKNTTKRAHDETVKKTYGTYTGQSNGLDITTGFADHLLLTKKDMNVYYYPVLGCDSNGTNCTKDGTTAHTYVEFSVPDQVRYYNADGTNYDWYQPVHERGNVLSYPWNETQLESRFTDQVTPLTKPPSCMLLGNGQTITNTSWTNGSTKAQSSGSTSSFSDELSMSYSEGVGVAGADSADVNYSLDVAAHTSLNTLNESTSSTSASHGITLTTPDFGYSPNCCGYGFGQYIFGLKNKQHPASENACSPGETEGCVPINDPDGNAVDIPSTGPLFTGYIASPVDGDCAGKTTPWWQNVYTKPDVALNHSEHWNWDPTGGKVSFIKANSTQVLMDNQFYMMKGFFITRKSAGGFENLNLPSSPNLALANADDPLTLTTRVYNYSLMDTPQNAPVHARFYGQLYCSSLGETSCTNWKTKATCSAGDVCGDSFQIGQDQVIPSIAGFNSATGNGASNWKLASVDFTPTNYPATQSGNLHMVFWVVVWMQDTNGKLVEEMSGHGLTAIPSPGLTQITQVATQDYSNNAGMYPMHGFFQILPVGATLPGGTLEGGSLKSISLSTSSQISLEQRAKVVATVQATGTRVKSVNIAYFDGDPAKNGTLIDTQTIASMNPDVDYYHRTFLTPGTCGVHTLYAKAWIASSSAIEASATTNVTLDSVSFVQTLISSTQTANFTDAQLRSDLLALLNTALQSYQQGATQVAEATLGLYTQQLVAASGNGISASFANRLIRQSGVVLGCGPKGFSLSALPSIATVSAGNNASYSIAVTPSGGFSGAVSLTCTGVPQGATCDVSSQSVTLDGVNQSSVTVSVTTSAQPHSAGVIGGLPLFGAGRLKWFMMFLAAVLAIAILQRGRLRYPILGCVVLMMLLSGIGCGGSSSHGTPPGYYPLTIQATSGSTNQILRVSLHVQ